MNEHFKTGDIVRFKERFRETRNQRFVATGVESYMVLVEHYPKSPFVLVSIHESFLEVDSARQHAAVLPTDE